jgi:AraC-like DNA-binding protein
MQFRPSDSCLDEAQGCAYAGRVKTENFRELEAFIGANPVLDARWSVVGTGDRRWGEKSHAAGNCWMMSRYTIPGMIGEASASKDSYGFWVPLHGGRWKINGVDLDRDGIAVSEPNSEFCGSCVGEEGWYLFHVPSHLFEEASGEQRRPHPYLYVVPHQRERGDMVRAVFRRVAEAIAENPSIESSPAMRMVEADLRSILEPVVGLVIGGGRVVVPAGDDRRRLSRREIIFRSKAVLDEREDQPLHVSELARLVGVSERTLRRAFSEYFCVGPRTYLLLRQLHQVHRDLLASHPEQTTVTGILTRWGVWELGRFAGRYMRHFGELPSRTLLRPPIPTEQHG